MVGAVKEAVAEPARKRELHFPHITGRELDRPAGPRAVDRLPVMARDVGHILRRLEASFDLQAGDAELDQAGDQVEGGQVLRAEQVLRFTEVNGLAVADDLVGHAASLGALAAIGRPAAERFAGEALARIRDAERTVNEHFERHVGLAANLADLCE